ncbi:MAG: flagellar basal body P-ring protein FlgI, partial [Alphaproteobacteria bacterium]|nr:flagellar basal body P-ring protein FlgI [Alphaproteobacteria bacterium]
DTIAQPTDPSTVHVRIPKIFKNKLVRFMTEIEQLRIRPDQTAKVVIDDTNGVIVVGKDVRINPVAVTQGSITVTVSEEPVVSQPNTQGATFYNTALLGENNFANSLSQLQIAQRSLIVSNYEEKKRIVQNDNTITDGDRQQKITELNEQMSSELLVLQNQHMSQMTQLQQQSIAGAAAGPKNDGIRTVEGTNTSAGFVEEMGKFFILDTGTTLEEMVNALNSLGVTPKEMGSILRAIKVAGALQADIQET